jgi:preprotein translocase subunit SecA
MKTFTPFEAMSHVVSFFVPRSSTPGRADYALVQRIRERADAHRGDTDQQLVEGTRQLQHLVQTGTDPTAQDSLLPGFALVLEATRRVLGMSHYDVQLLAGLALTRGKIAEMQTGEGKTLVAALPAFIRALTGKGVHVLTVNDYLAQRDHDLLAPVIRLLGMTVGFLSPRAPNELKQQAYACDITYGPGYEFGFDYLRDQATLLATRKPRLGERYTDRLRGRHGSGSRSLQRGFYFCVVDEVDSVLLDEAATPLLLATRTQHREGSNSAYLIAQQAADTLTEPQDYLIDRVGSRVSLTAQGVRNIDQDGRRAAASGLLRPWTVYVRHALQAKLLLNRDVDYIVSDDQVQLVDKNTGRIFSDRSWRDGLHQAVEVKEGVAVTPEQRPLGQISRQRYFRLYDGLCGMTGTATGNEGELQHFYRLPVVVIPTRKTSQRKAFPTRYFADEKSKLTAIVAEISRNHATGQPVLVGTRTIEISEVLAQALGSNDIPFRLLNGKQDEEEARIIAAAGESGAITIATNMAGRGTDIKLGPGVVQLGGLHVLGTERHESARVDRQLIGRAARQGNPGSYQFFVSAEDQLITQYAPAIGQRMQRTAGTDRETDHDFTEEVAKVQRQVERLHFEQRKQMFAHEQWKKNVLAALAEER